MTNPTNQMAQEVYGVFKNHVYHVDEDGTGKKMVTITETVGLFESETDARITCEAYNKNAKGWYTYGEVHINPPMNREGNE